MQRRALGDTGIGVGVVGLGCNYFGWRLDAAQVCSMLDESLDLGINYLDMADMYGNPPGRGEELLGEALQGRRDKFVVCTKVGGVGKFRRRGERWGRRAHLERALDASLRRLRTDYIDLYQLHFPDPSTPLAETLGVFDDFVKQGKVRVIGHSQFSALEIAETEISAREHGQHRFVVAQNEWNLLERENEEDVIPACRQYKLDQIPFRPLAGGMLSGKYRADQPFPPGTRMADLQHMRAHRVATSENFDRVQALEVFAREHGRSLLELAIAWLLAQPGVPTVPVGASKPEQLRANVTGGEWKLKAEDLAAIDRLSPFRSRQRRRAPAIAHR